MAPNRLRQGKGCFAALTPGYQAQQLANQQAGLQLKQEQAFQGGFPIDAQGNPDWGAAAQRSAQLGDFGTADKFQTIGLQMGSIAAAQRNAAMVGQFGGSGGQAAAAASPAVAPGASAPSGSPMAPFQHAIGSIESSNRYDALGPVQKSGDQAVGRYQVMASNIPSWTKDVLGQSMNSDQFLASPQAQDAVFNAKFGGYLKQYGTPQDAASMWFTGRPLKQAGNASDSLGTTAPIYVKNFMAALQGGGGQAQPGTQPAPSPAQPGAPIAAVAGGQAQPISSGGPATSAASSSDAPIGDDQVMAARQLVADSENSDPRAMTPAQQRAVSAATLLIDRYKDQQAQPLSTASSASSSGTPPPAAAAALARLQAKQGTPADAQVWGAYQASLKQGGASPGTTNGAPGQASDDAPMPGRHPYFPGGSGIKSPPAAPGTPMAGAAPGAAPPGQGGGFQPASFGGGAPPLAGQPTPASGGLPPASSASAPQNGQLAVPRQTPTPTVPTTPPVALLDPSFAGQVPRAWLAAGHSAGEWVNYARAQAAINGALPFNAGKANEDSWNKIADGMANSIDKSMQYTPEQRNARDAAAVAYEQSRTDYQNRSRLAADTDPSRNVFAGNQAYATAAGTAAGQNSPDAVAGAANKAGAVGEAQGQGKYFGGLPAAYAQQADAARATSDNVDQMLQAAQGFRMGAGSGIEQDARKTLQGTLGFLGVSDPKLNDPTAKYEDFGKMAGVLNRNAAQQVGGRTGVQEMQLIASTLPSPEMSYDGFRTVASSLKGSADYTIAKQQAAHRIGSPIRRTRVPSPGSKRASIATRAPPPSG